MIEVKAIVDLQFGSTGKGLLAGYLASTWKPDTVVTAWSPNAGHTFIDASDRKYTHTMLANGVVSPALERVMIGPGSVIDLDALEREIRECADHLALTQIIIHIRAGVVRDRHREHEKVYNRIGSTQKGSGAVVLDKIERDKNTDPAMTIYDFAKLWAVADSVGAQLVIANQDLWQRILESTKRVLVEGAQGYSLGINSGMWPYTTSRECTVAQLMSDCAVPWRQARSAEVWGTMRPYPIRVANRLDEDGNMVGYSGPGYSDQREITWSDIGQVPEKTTVTKLVRRVFTFSDTQVLEAVAANGVDKIFLNFVNYLLDHQNPRGADDMRYLYQFLHDYALPLALEGRGPSVTDITKFLEEI